MKQIKEFPDYFITEDGKVWSNITNKFLKPGKDGSGYLHVNLKMPKDHPEYNYSVRPFRMRKIHQLVARTYIENPNNFPCINHIDGNKLNNNVSNLEWCTYAYNNAHAVEHGLRQITPRKIKDLKEILEDFLTGNYTVKALEEKYDWHTSANFTGRYLHEYAKKVGKEEEYLKIKQGLKKKAASLGTEALKRPTNAYTLDGTFIKSFSCQKEAAEFFNTTLTVVNHSCKHKVNKPRVGIIFRYVEDPFILEP